MQNLRGAFMAARTRPSACGVALHLQLGSKLSHGSALPIGEFTPCFVIGPSAGHLDTKQQGNPTFKLVEPGFTRDTSLGGDDVTLFAR